jgi:hypothetical protein
MGIVSKMFKGFQAIGMKSIVTAAGLVSGVVPQL